MTPTQQAIVAGAIQAGVDPATALAVAERESNFNTQARSSKTIRGAFQMRGDLRNQYGVGDSNDAGDQTRGWGRFFRQNKYEMAQVLGRQPTDEEGYLGHHFGGARAARMLKMDPNTPVDQVFTPNEMAQNPHFGRAGTVGNLNSSILSDMTARHAKFHEELPDLSGEADKPDFASFGTPMKTVNLAPESTAPDPNMALEERKFSAPEGTPPPPPTMEQQMPTPQPSAPSPPKSIDLAQFGTPA